MGFSFLKEDWPLAIFFTKHLFPVVTTSSTFYVIIYSLFFFPIVVNSCLQSSCPAFGQKEDLLYHEIYGCLSIIITGIFHFPQIPPLGHPEPASPTVQHAPRDKFPAISCCVGRKCKLILTLAHPQTIIRIF